MNKTVADDLFDSTQWRHPSRGAGPASIGVEPIYPVALKRHALWVVAAVATTMRSAPHRICRHGLAEAETGAPSFKPHAPDVTRVSAVGLIRRSVAWLFLRGCPLRICMAQAVQTTVERWCFELVPVVCAEEADRVRGRLQVETLLQWQNLLRPSVEEAAGFFDAVRDHIAATPHDDVFELVFGDASKAPYRYPTPAGGEDTVVAIDAEPF